MRLAPWLCMLYPTNIFTSSPSSTPYDHHQRSKIFFWNYFNLTSAERARSRKYIQTLADSFSVSSKPFIWMGLHFRNYLTLLKASPPSTTSLKESIVKKKKKNLFSKPVPTPHSETVCVNESRKESILTLDTSIAMVEGGEAFSKMRKFQKSRPTHMKGFDETEKRSTSIWMYLCDWVFSTKVKL